MNASTGSLIVAIISVVIAAFSVYISRKATKAALRSAKAAEAQAEGVRDQVRQAEAMSYQTREAFDLSKLALLDSARHRTEDLSPRPIVAAELATDVLFMEEMPFEGERHVVDMPEELDFWAHRWNYLGFIVRGALINDSDKAMRVVPDGPRFIGGRSSLTEHVVRKPVRIHPSWHMYLIEGNELALFEWNAYSTVDNWIDLSKNVKESVSVAASFICWPGSYDGITTRVNMELASDVVGPIWGKKDKWQVERLPPNVRIEYERNYETDVKRLREELTKKYERW